jgi:hypothetical protein
MINTVIDIVNKQISGFGAEEKIFNIAESILKITGSEQIKMPGIVLPDGEIKYVGIDDIFSFMVYHKINSISITQLTNGIGDNFGDIKNIFNVSAFIYWDMQKIKESIDKMLFIIQSRLPLLIKGIDDIKTVAIKLINSNINSYQLYRQEYEYENIKPLPENKKIIQINYNAEITFKPECFRQCPECS